MKVEANTRLRSITVQQWCYLAFTSLVALPLVLALAFQYQIYDWYLVHFVEPELEQLLGFRAGTVQISGPDGPYPMYAVVSVEPGGRFDRAGVKSGDIPFAYVHGVQSGFLSYLHHDRGHAVKLRFVNHSDMLKGHWTEREVVVTVPSDAPADSR